MAAAPNGDTIAASQDLVVACRAQRLRLTEVHTKGVSRGARFQARSTAGAANGSSRARCSRRSESHRHELARARCPRGWGWCRGSTANDARSR